MIIMIMIMIIIIITLMDDTITENSVVYIAFH